MRWFRMPWPDHWTGSKWLGEALPGAIRAAERVKWLFRPARLPVRGFRSFREWPALRCTLDLNWIRLPFFLLLAGLGLPAQTSIILSHDLVSLGIAPANLTPNQPDQDARPAMQAALQYAQAHGVGTITADAGALFLITQASGDPYITLYGLSNLTMDLRGCDLYFAESHRPAR